MLCFKALRTVCSEVNLIPRKSFSVAKLMGKGVFRGDNICKSKGRIIACVNDPKG